MTDLETLKAMLKAAGIETEGASLSAGTLEWQPASDLPLDHKAALDVVRTWVTARATGWILFTDALVEPDGNWQRAWNDLHLLDAELVDDKGSTSLRITHANGTWIVATATSATTGGGILETVITRRHGGGTITHQVAWTGVPLRPSSARLTKVQK